MENRANIVLRFDTIIQFFFFNLLDGVNFLLFESVILTKKKKVLNCVTPLFLLFPIIVQSTNVCVGIII